MEIFDVHRGDGCIVLGQPHGGTHVPADVASRLNENGQRLADTDWHINRLYEGVLPGATVVYGHVHRYVIDANRDPSGVSLYPGQNTTTLVPMTDFDGQAIWLDRQEPSVDEIEDRRRTFHAPYHAALEEELQRVKAKHGIAVLFDCHSIRSRIPYLFEGTLPDMNVGTDSGATCAPEIETITQEFADSSPYSSVLNGRFRGGWTTRHYGRPTEGLHAVQMELAQSTYLASEAAPWAFDDNKAMRLRRWLHDILNVIEDTALELVS